MSVTTKIIDLVELRSEDGFPAYAAIRPGGDASPFVLSPAAMCWHDDLLLVRLSDCREFWLNQKKKTPGQSQRSVRALAATSLR